MFKRILAVLVGALVLLSIALVVNALRAPSRQLTVVPAAPITLDTDAAAQRLAATLKLKTIASSDDPAQNLDQFELLRAYLQNAFPHAHAELKREIIGGNSLLYRWQGSDPQATPVLWMAHQDVVPVAPDTEAAWGEPPFAGSVKDGFIWGRGAWDDKGNLCAQLEAIEQLAAAGFQPRRTLYLAYGADEEVGGLRGAKVIAEKLKERGVRFDYVLDEGLLVTEGIIKGLDRPAALIGVASKGYATVKLQLDAAPGHASMPPTHSAIGMMSEALARLERNQFRPHLHGVARDMLETLAPEMDMRNRVLLSNMWLLRPLLENELSKTASTNALLRTTTALTMVHAGNKDNVLPGHVEATVNFRLLPGDSQAMVLDHVRSIIYNDAIKVTLAPGGDEPSPVSPIGGAPFKTINKTVREVFPEAVVAPGLMIGASDSRHFAALSENVFTFSPVRATGADLARFHGTNERLSVKNYADMIRFYHQLLKNS